MYDEFGNLKKKFRAKMQRAEAAQSLPPGVGRAGWEAEELGRGNSFVVCVVHNEGFKVLHFLCPCFPPSFYSINQTP